MKKKDLVELKSKNTHQLEEKIHQLEKEKFNAQIELKMAKGKNFHLVAQKKKDIAKVKTILALKIFAEKLENQKGKNATD